MLASPNELPTIGKDFWDILHMGTDHLRPQFITIYGTNGCLMGLSFLEAGDGIDGVEAVKLSAREGIEYSLIAGVKDIISNASVVSKYRPEVSQFLKSNSLTSLVGLANDIWYINRAMKNIPQVVEFMKKSEYPNTERSVKGWG